MAKMFGESSTTDEVLSGVNLNGKRVLVAGVSAGLGVETARSLAAHGAQVAEAPWRRSEELFPAHVANHLPGKAAGVGKEDPRHDGLDVGFFVRPRDRTDGHVARYPGVNRSVGSHAS